MSMLRVIAIAFSLLVHASIGLAMLPSLQKTETEALEMGTGDDAVVIEQGIALEGLAFGDSMETIETAEVAPIVAPPPPPEEVKPVEELRDVVTSEASSAQDEVPKTEEEPPPEEVVEKEPEPVQPLEQPEQVAIVTEQSSGEEQTGGDAKALGIYLGKVNSFVQRAKINPRSRVTGTVIMRFTIGTAGTLLSKEVASSSGSKVLDDAAVNALDRAAPFPPIPPEVSIKPLAFTQPFKFITR